MTTALAVAVKPGVPAVCLSAHVRDEPLTEAVLIPDPLRPRKAVRGARTAGGERTWLRQQESGAGRHTLPGCATVRVSCSGRSFVFQLEQGALASARRRPLSCLLTRRCPVGPPLQPRRLQAPACSGSPSQLDSSLNSAGASRLRARLLPRGVLDVRLEWLCSLLQYGFVVQLRFRDALSSALMLSQRVTGFGRSPPLFDSREQRRIL